MALKFVFVLLLLLGIQEQCVGFGAFRKVGCQRFLKTSTTLFSGKQQEIDPNVEAHLAQWMKKGLAEERSAPEIASELRARYKKITDVKRKAASVVKNVNPELAAELEEMALEMSETSEKFVSIALEWDAWGRPDPELPNQLRQAKEVFDPNFEANKAKFMSAGRKDNRPDYDLPSELRMLKYKNVANVKRLAANEIRKQGTSNEELAKELEEIASEIEESHDNFVRVAEAIKSKKYQDQD